MQSDWFHKRFINGGKRLFKTSKQQAGYRGYCGGIMIKQQIRVFCDNGKDCG